MKLLTVGDSFTVGEELQDSQAAWPCLLAQQCQWTLTNLAERGASNDRILRKTVSHLINPFNEQPDLVIVAWSNLGRQEFADEIGNYDVWPGFNETMIEDSLSWRRELVRYVSKYHNSQWYLERFFQQVLLLQSFLVNRNQRYLMLNIRQHEYYRSKHFDQKPFYIQQIDQSKFIGFEHSGMIEWTQHCACGPGGHFLEQGHQIVAEKIYEHIGNLGWLS